MVVLIHEIWETTDESGTVLPGVCLAGPRGEEFRLLNKSGRCVRRFEAGSHFEAMTIYYHHYGWGDYRSEFAWDREPYPQDWQIANPPTGDSMPVV